MSASSGQKRINHFTTKSAQKTQAEAAEEANVLYQKLGDKWYAFSVIQDEVYVGELERSEASQIRNIHEKGRR